MSAVIDASAYFPGRPPTWLEVGLALLMTGTVAGKVLRGEGVSWPALWVGFAVFAVALGSGAQSALGARVGLSCCPRPADRTVVQNRSRFPRM